MSQKRILIFACVLGALCFIAGDFCPSRHSRINFGRVPANDLLVEESPPQKEMAVWALREGGMKLRAGKFENARRAVRLAEFFGSKKKAETLKTSGGSRVSGLVKKLEAENDAAVLLHDERAGRRIELLLAMMKKDRRVKDEDIPKK